jgi:hypothetical protein
MTTAAVTRRESITTERKDKIKERQVYLMTRRREENSSKSDWVFIHFAVDASHWLVSELT